MSTELDLDDVAAQSQKAHQELTEMRDLMAATADALDYLTGLTPAQAGKLRKDAERYRWLRDKAPGEIVFDHTTGNSDGGNRFVMYVPFDGEPIDNDAESAARLDASIDAAIHDAGAKA